MSLTFLLITLVYFSIYMLDNDQKSENEKNGELHRLIMMTVPTLCICLCQGLAVKWLV